jgi:CBS domain-containing protein
MRVADRMTTEPVTVCSPTTIEDALRSMEDRKLEHLPVVDDTDKLLGWVSETDLRGEVERSAHGRRGVSFRGTVADSMRPAVCVNRDLPWGFAAWRMLEMGVDVMCVVSRDRLVGIVHEGDALEAYVHSCRSAGGRAGSVQRVVDPQVAHCMSRRVSDLPAPGDSVSVVARRLRKLGLQDLPVVDGKRAVGTVARGSLARALEDREATADGAASSRGIATGVRAFTAVREVMSRPAPSIEASRPLARAAEELLRTGVCALAVTRDQEVVGFVSRRTVLRAASTARHLVEASVELNGTYDPVQEAAFACVFPTLVY